MIFIPPGYRFKVTSLFSFHTSPWENQSPCGNSHILFLRKNDVVAPNSRWFKRECKKNEHKGSQKVLPQKRNNHQESKDNFRRAILIFRSTVLLRFLFFSEELFMNEFLNFDFMFVRDSYKDAVHFFSGRTDDFRLKN